jgi:poly-beta-1,6-N-acetyl-D-glucosamine synthase
MIGILFWFFVAAILYTYLGYPLLVTVLARLRPVPQYAQGETPSVTLLIAAYNEESVIERKIENSLKLDYPHQKLQILIAADGSDDRTVEIVQQFSSQGIELSFDPARAGKMAAINRAMPNARGEIVIFSDANNSYAPNTLRELIIPFTDPSVGAVSGAKHILKDDSTLGESEGLYWKFESFIKKQETRLGNCTGVAGEILAMRRELFTPPPARVINDDFYMGMHLLREGHRLVYAPNAKSFERVSPTTQDEIARRTRIVAGRFQAISMAPDLLTFRRPVVVWQIVSHKFLRPLVPFGMIGALTANLAAVIIPPHQENLRLLHLAPPYNTLFLVVQILFYLTALAGSTVERNTRLGKLVYLPTFLVNSNFAALAGLFRFLTGRQTALWKRIRRHEEV